MMWVGIIIAVYLFSAVMALIGSDQYSETNRRMYSYSCVFIMAFLMVLVFMNMH